MPDAVKASYHDYQVVVGGRIVKLQDLALEDARLALKASIDLIVDLETRTQQTALQIERWIEGKT